MNFTLMVMDGPDSSRAQARALGFAQAAVAQGHRVCRVFFYGAGARIGLPWDDDARARWHALSQAADTELVLCSASAERYGMRDAPSGYVIAGLGALMEAGLDSDRIVSFG